MDHPAVIFRFISDWERRQGCMAFREVLVTQVREVLRAWLRGAGKRPAARRADVDVKTPARYIKAAQAAGMARGGDESQLGDELIGQVAARQAEAQMACADKLPQSADRLRSAATAPFWHLESTALGVHAETSALMMGRDDQTNNHDDRSGRKYQDHREDVLEDPVLACCPLPFLQRDSAPGRTIARGEDRAG